MTIWNTDGLAEVCDSAIAAEFFPLLRNAIAPLRALPVRPILFARATQLMLAPPPANFPSYADFANTFQRASEPFYHVQYGPRAWKTQHLCWPSVFTSYEKPLETMGEALEQGKWTALGRALLAATLDRPSTPNDTQPDLAVVIAQGGDGFLVLGDQPRGSIVYEIASEGLRLLGYAHPTCLRGLDHARRRLLRPLGEDVSKEKMTKDLLKEDVLWRYGTKLADATRPVFLEAFEKMRAIAPEVAMAYSAARFNDACGDDNWSAVRVNNFAWESGCYFRNDGAALAAAPVAIHTALGLLHHLLACQIARRFTASFGMEVDPLDAIGFFLQENECYFSCSCTNGDDGPVYRVDPRTGEAQFVGVAERFDWNFNTGPCDAHRGTPARNCLEWTPVDAWLEQVPSREAGAARDSGFQRLAGVDWEDYFRPERG